MFVPYMTVTYSVPDWDMTLHARGFLSDVFLLIGLLRSLQYPGDGGEFPIHVLTFFLIHLAKLCCTFSNRQEHMLKQLYVVYVWDGWHDE